MLRILVLTSRFPDRLRPNLGNFVERQCLELAARPGVEVEVVAPLGRAPFPLSLVASRALDGLPGQEVWKGIIVHRPRFPQLRYLPMLRPPALAWQLLPLARALRDRFAFDVISAEFSWPDGPAAVAVGRALGVPVTIKARGMEFERRIGSSATRAALLRACRAADGLLAVSGETRDKMASAGLPRERIAVHYPGVDTSLFRPGDRHAAKERLGIIGPLLVTVGNLIPEKRQWLAIETLARIETATLIVAGAGPEAGALLARARRLGVANRLSLRGSVPHPLLPAFYIAADVTLHCSAVEGFGNVRLESLACGTPVVTTAAGEAARVIDRPEYGRIVAAEPAAMAAAVQELLANPPPPTAVSAAAEYFTWERNAAQMEMLLQNALRAARRKP